MPRLPTFKRVFSCSVLVLGMGTGSPTFRDSKYLLFESANLPEPPADRATVYVVREQRGAMSPEPFERVYLDGEPAGILPQRSWFVLQVAQGPRRLSGIMFGSDLLLECKAGREYLLRLREISDADGRKTRELLLDDPMTVRELIAKKRVSFVETTSRGMEHLRRWVASRADMRPRAPIDPRGHSEPDTLVHILVEKPMDPVNLQTEFSGLTGRVILDRSAIRYELIDSIATSLVSRRNVKDVFEIPHAGIRRVRFDGTRFTGVTPWVNILYYTPNGMRTVSFADARESHGAKTYNRIFALAQDFAELSRQALADSAQRNPDAGTDPAKP